MEVGAVKQAFNNELILLKKKLNQAKTQVIHKLTRKAKTLAEKKCPEPLKEKYKRKAESAIKEVLIIKKIKPKDIGKFTVTHTGKLQDYLNKPLIDNNKACARLLLHKVLEDKYEFLRSRFSDVPIKDLFMSRQERRKIKKEARQEQKDKRKKKEKVKAAKAEGDWNVEDVQIGDISEELDNDLSGDGGSSDDEKGSVDESEHSDDEVGNSESDSHEANEQSDQNEMGSDIDDEEDANAGKFVKISPPKVINSKTKNKSPVKVDNNLKPEKEAKLTNKRSLEIETVPKKENVEIENKFKLIETEIRKKQEKKPKDSNKNKNFNEKLLQRKFKKDLMETPIEENKIVDPFFITSTGENYMSLAETRQPDEVKEVHKEGNRKMRRAVMFGYAPKYKPRNDNYDNTRNNSKSFDTHQSRFENQNGFTSNRFNDSSEINEDKSRFKRSIDVESKPEKLHPSWEAKKRQSGILPFQGKKIVFDES